MPPYFIGAQVQIRPLRRALNPLESGQLSSLASFRGAFGF